MVGVDLKIFDVEVWAACNNAVYDCEALFLRQRVVAFRIYSTSPTRIRWVYVFCPGTSETTYSRLGSLWRLFPVNIIDLGTELKGFYGLERPLSRCRTPLLIPAKYQVALLNLSPLVVHREASLYLRTLI